MRGSIFSLSAAAIGSGVLELPYVLRINGWILGTLMILVGALSGYYSNKMILKRSIEVKAKNYSDLCQIGGGRPLKLALQITLLVFFWGVCLSY